MKIFGRFKILLRVEGTKTVYLHSLVIFLPFAMLIDTPKCRNGNEKSSDSTVDGCFFYIQYVDGK